ncbi:2'-5' RNA ligase family protein [Psychrilyobacter atlanticus]|uniref:2'-5' RNA ligase family protein n=1 Tax=Psychrilyobacter atlanticus TaxID=271091 RepID=UPI000427711C|nr:2'-5' RNA ligase family protein [Psychrilyobacter atlanticus]
MKNGHNKKELYFIGILPPKGILAEIEELKKICMKKFNSKHALKLPAHITLIPPFYSNEQKILSLKAGLSGILKKDISVELNGFSYFDKKVIYIDVQKNKNLFNLKKHIDDKVLIKHKIKTADINFIPHITIASKDLTDESFLLSREYFKGIEYKRSFKVKNIVIFKLEALGWNKFISL